MAQSAFSFPKQSEDWASWGLGIWLVLSPWTFFFDLETRATENAVAIGALILVAEVVELSIFRDWEEWINVAAGAWLVVSPWVLGIASVAAWVGAGGLGTLIFAGIDQGNDAKAVTGAIAAMVLALAADGVLRALERRYVVSR